VVDTHPDRLALAEQLGAVAINGVGDEAVNKILEGRNPASSVACQPVGKMSESKT
jgi:glutathione-independent formaldehyde dehydrogenase